MSRNAVGSLTHRFVRGLRCDNQLRYVTAEARGMQMLAALPLSWPGSTSGDESGRLCLLRAAVVVARTRAPGLAATLPALIESHAVAQWCAQSALQLAASVKTVPHSEVGSTIAATLDATGACGVLLHAAAGARWALVAGTETDDSDGRVRALLLLDPGRAMPWCAGFNARFELRRSSPSPRELVYRSIEGEQYGVRLGALLTVKPSGS